jgi:DNA transformation protein and related proteins
MDDFTLKQARLAKLPNIGLKSAGWMIEVGIDTPEKFFEIGAVETYSRMKAVYPKGMSICGLWALEGALRGVPHKMLGVEMKKTLKQTYVDFRELQK